MKVDMSLIDELRFAVASAMTNDDSVFYAIDAFAAMHPDIVDLTKCGPQCPAYRADGGEQRCDALDTLAPVDRACLILDDRKRTRQWQYRRAVRHRRFEEALIGESGR